MDLIYSIFESYGLLVLLIIVFVAQLGLPVGSTFFLMWYGSTLNSISSLAIAIIATICVAILGDITAYSLGKQFSSQLKHAEQRYQWLADKARQSQTLLDRYDVWIIWLSRFLITGLGPFVNYILGSKKYPLKKFIFWVFLGETIFALELLYFGYHFKESWEDLLALVSDVGWLIALLFILYFVSKKLFLKH